MLQNAFVISVVVMMASVALWTVAMFILHPAYTVMSLFVIFTFCASVDFSLSFTNFNDIAHAPPWRLILDTCFHLGLALSASLMTRSNVKEIANKFSKVAA